MDGRGRGAVAEVRRRAGRAFLPEVQALRMWAVGLVVAFHLWPSGWVHGGFVGVDAFFVISGFLITGHLVREVESTGRVRLAAFYARRARRLLPASLVVLVVAAALTFAFLPQDAWAGTAQEVMASTVYVQNLWLASRAVTYSASTQAASPVQHYWSLSTEEQFYLVWPSLILLALLVSRRWWPRRPVAAVGGVLTAVALASFVCSLVVTARDASAAYFVTTTRAWEFAAGAVLPLVLRRWAPSAGLAVGLRYGGLTLLVGSALALSQATPFPGCAALWPVLGAACVVLAGDCDGRDPAQRLLWSNRVVQWLGDVSYSVYLWHWPLIVVAPFLVGGSLGVPHEVAIVVLTLVLAHLSKRYVEDVARQMPRVRRSARLSLLAAAAGMVVVALVGASLNGAASWAEQRREDTLAAQLGGPCVGGRAGLDPSRCPGAFTAPPLVAVGEGDMPWRHDDGCTERHQPYMDCGWGARSKTVALVGDSHAEHYAAALHAIARQRGWRMLLFVKQRCPAVDAPVPAFLGSPRTDPDGCRQWQQEVTRQMRSMGVSLVVTSAYSRASPVQGDADGAYQRVWRSWASFADVVVVRDVPSTGEKDMPACVKQHADDLRACAMPRTQALAGDQMYDAARADHDDRVHLVDLSDAYCDASTCYAVGGGLPIYYDRNHVAYSFMQTLAPALEARLPH